jgi:hypothetical protein
VIDDFRSLELHGTGRPERNKGSQDKGHRAQLDVFRAQLEGREEPAGPSPVDTMAVTLAALRAAEGGAPVSLTH